MSNAIRVRSHKTAVLIDNLKNFSFAFPAIAVFSIFYIFPFFYIFKLSLFEWDGLSPFMNFVALDNFKELMTDKIWWTSMWHACYITLIALTFQNCLAFALALACDREIRMKNFYRVVFFLPPVLSEVVVGFIWRWVLNAQQQGGEYFGLLNYFLTKVGLTHLVTDWLSNPDTALTCIAVVHSWKGFGWGFIMLLAGLQTIDRQLYDAARVDGASSWSTFWNIKIPMMMPVILVVIILTVLGSMQVFVLIMSMVGQGLEYEAEVPVTRILAAMTSTKRYGYACSMGVTFGMILIMISFAFKQITDRTKQA